MEPRGGCLSARHTAQVLRDKLLFFACIVFDTKQTGPVETTGPGWEYFAILMKNESLVRLV